MATASKTGLSDRDYARFHHLVLETSGIDVPESRRRDLEKAVLQLLAERGSPDTEALFRLLAHEPAGRVALEALAGAVTIGETHFFRNRPQFEALERRILPDLIARRRDTRRLRVWSAGCATGEEPYSVAVLLQRLLPDLDEWHATILATDIDRVALESGRRGRYRQWSFRGMPAHLGTGWFTERDGVVEVRPQIRDRVTFDFLNLMDDVYPSFHTNTQAMDLILCRNVLMYFPERVARGVVDRLHESLAEGGWLVVGHTEPSQELFRRFQVHNLPGTVVYHKPGSPPSPPPPRRARPRPAASRARTPAPPSRPARGETPAPRPSAEEARAEAAALLQAGRLDEARLRLEALVASEPREVEAPYLLAKMAANRLEVDAASRWLDVALERSPVHAPSHYLRGLLLEEEGRRDAALHAYRRCLYADPGFVLGHFALAGVFRATGQHRRARTSLDNVERLVGDRERDEPVAESDGMTVGRLLELAVVHRGFIDQDEARR